jgi:hypothetical protein
MKSHNLLSMVIAGILLVTAVSCTSTRDIYQEDDDRVSRQTPHRILVDDPYYGTIVMERDPFTGRYYQVGSYGQSAYGYGNDRYRDSRYYRDYPRRQVIVQRNETPSQTPQQKEQSRQEARRKVLGN